MLFLFRKQPGVGVGVAYAYARKQLLRRFDDAVGTVVKIGIAAEHRGMTTAAGFFMEAFADFRIGIRERIGGGWENRK